MNNSCDYKLLKWALIFLAQFFIFANSAIAYDTYNVANPLRLIGYATGQMPSTAQVTYSTASGTYRLHIRIPENSSGTISLSAMDSDSTAQWQVISRIPKYLSQPSTPNPTVDELSYSFHTGKDYVWNGTMSVVVSDRNDVSTLLVTFDVYGVDEKPVYDIPSQLTIHDNVFDVTTAITNSSGTVILPTGQYNTTSFTVSITEQDSYDLIDGVVQVSLLTTQKFIAFHSLGGSGGGGSDVPISAYYDIKGAPLSTSYTQKTTLFAKLSDTSYQETVTLTVLHESGEQKQFVIPIYYQTDGNTGDGNTDDAEAAGNGGSSSSGCALTPNAQHAFSPTFIILLLISALMILYRRRKNFGGLSS